MKTALDYLKDFIQIEEFPEYFISKQGKVLRIIEENGYIASNGYPMINMYNKNGIRRGMTLHRLLANAFIPNIHNKPQVAHNDGDRKNYSIENLRWATNYENVQDKLEHEKLNVGFKPHHHRLKDFEVNLIRKYAKLGLSYSDIADVFKMQAKHISNIVKERIWKNIGVLNE